MVPCGSQVTTFTRARGYVTNMRRVKLTSAIQCSYTVSSMRISVYNTQGYTDGSLPAPAQSPRLCPEVRLPLSRPMILRSAL